MCYNYVLLMSSSIAMYVSMYIATCGNFIVAIFHSVIHVNLLVIVWVLLVATSLNVYHPV